MSANRWHNGRRVRWGLAICSVALVVVAGVALAAVAQGRAAPPPAAEAASLADPGAPGPYAVGVTRRGLTRPSSTTGAPREVEPAIWYPATPAAAALPPHERFGAPVDAAPEPAGRPYPVVVYSSGAGGGAGGNSFFNTHLASHGFVVVGVTHPGLTPPPCPFRVCTAANAEAAEWLFEQNSNRLDDVRYQLEAVLELSASGDPILGGMLDPARIGMSGGSSGAITALDTVTDDPRYRAVVAQAPAATPVERRALRERAPRVDVPTMLFAGELDTQPFAEQEALFAALAAGGPERWFVAVPRAGHSMLLDWCPDVNPECGLDSQPLPHVLAHPEAHARINRWSTAFLLRHVAGDARYAALLDPALAAGDPEVRVTVGGTS